jgi:cytidylate kinase
VAGRAREAMAVIAINQQIGSRGADLGRLVAQRLDYRFLTSAEISAETASRYHVSAEQLKVADERLPHFWERLTTDVHRMNTFFRAVVLKEMARDRLVIVGRFLALILPEGGRGLRVRAAGPFAERVRQTAIDEGLDHSAGERRVRDSDREVRARVQHLYGVDIDDPALYTVVLNTAAMPLQALAPTLVACAHEVERDCGEGLDVIRDVAIAEQVRAALLAHPQIGKAQVDVRCRSGAVQVVGSGLVPPWDELVEQVARQVEGVASVNVNADEPPIAPRSS